MRRFKHKISGLVINGTNSEGYTSHEISGLFLTKGIVENSQDWEEIMEPLWRTTDGVDIFDGDKYHSVLCNNFSYKGEYISETPNHGRYTDLRSYKTFSTKEAAEQYIEENKPKYSLNDVENAYGKYISVEKDFVLKNLKELDK